MDIVHTAEQQRAVYSLIDGVNPYGGVQSLGGYAGTGKTTCIKSLREYFKSFAVVAYTGKAANVLRRKGIPAQTIHSLIYIPEDVCGQTHFVRRDELEDVRGFIVDEASMVGRVIYHDLLSFGLPIILVGDHGELEPVERGLNLMNQPDFTLETIHRNAGDIPRFAEWVRHGEPSAMFNCRDGSVRLVREPSKEVVLATDQIICGFNKPRVGLNKLMRSLLGKSGLIEAGERVMCLRNDTSTGAFNGLQGVAARVEVQDEKFIMDFKTDSRLHRKLRIDPDQFGKEKAPDWNGDSNGHPFDYAYAITCHKAQGDEWDDVVVLEQRCRHWDHKRWAYTAASRAR
jgi:ATP-dependent exoDNAse (exonuclease V) alpha subunit